MRYFSLGLTSVLMAACSGGEKLSPGAAPYYFSEEPLYMEQANQLTLDSLYELKAELRATDSVCVRLIDQTLAEIESHLAELSEEYEQPLSHITFSKSYLLTYQLRPCVEYCRSITSSSSGDETANDCRPIRTWSSRMIDLDLKGLE